MIEKKQLVELVKKAGAEDWTPTTHDPGDFWIGTQHFVLKTLHCEQERLLRRRQEHRH